MKTTFCRTFALAVVLFLVTVTSACAEVSRPFSGRILIQNAISAGVAITQAESSAVDKAVYIEAVVCRNIYPAPQSDLACVKTMAAEIEKQFPDAMKKAKESGFMEVPAELVDPLSAEVYLLNARILGACRGGEFAKCMEKVYRTLPSAFDPHSGYISVEEFTEMRQSSTGSFSGIGVEVGGKKTEKDPLVVINPMEGSPGEKAGLLPGDLIVGISKDGTKEGMRSIETYATVNEAVKDIRGVKGTAVRLLVERVGEAGQREFVITRGVIDTQVVKSAILIEGNKRYGMIHGRQFDGQACVRTEEAYKKLTATGALDGLIVSVERDPGGYLHEAHCLLDLFTDAKSFVLQRDRQSITPYQPCRRDMLGQVYCQGDIKIHPGDITNGLPILVMINGGSASASEIFSAGMKHMGRAVIAGTPTFQKGSMQTIIPLGDGSAVKVTAAEFLVGTMEDWTNVQCLGVTPDIVYERGFDPKDKDGKRITDCGLEHSIRSGGPMQNAPTRPSIKDANSAHFAESVLMLEAYKKYATKEDEKVKQQEELMKKLRGKDE